MEEKIAVLETKVGRNEEDIAELVEVLKVHTEEEHTSRASVMKSLANIESKLNSQNSFWAGMVFSFTSIGAVIGLAIGLMNKNGGS